MATDLSVGNQPATRTPGTWSADGRTFTCTTSLDRAPGLGDVVVLVTDAGQQLLGQVRASAPAARSGDEAGVHEPTVVGSGVVLGVLDGADRPGSEAVRPFTSADLQPASAEVIEAAQRGRDAGLEVGTWRSGDVAVPARLRAAGFNRHTFLCGQSGSGKTYALGVVLEQLLLHTGVRLVVLDPNGDFTRLGQVRPDAPATVVDRLASTDLRVLRPDAGGGERLRMRFVDLPRQAQAAILRLDPLTDRNEFNLFLHIDERHGVRDVSTLVAGLRAGDADERALAQRIENLGLPQWEVWAGTHTSAADVVGSARATVMDLGGFRDPLEPQAVTLEVVEYLWRQRESRNPTLVVIDEAHNLCAAEPQGPVQVAVTERLIQIAAEGRKYGLWLLLSTQRPSKIHPQVLSQCDNLMLMRMNSPSDLAELATLFGFAPEQMLHTSPFFAQGEALFAGGFVPAPMFARVSARVTMEGGSDVTVPLTPDDGSLVG
jgi:DNA helicase HerA-like ATPase